MYITTNSVCSFFCDSAKQRWCHLLSPLQVLVYAGLIAFMVMFSSHNALVSFWTSAFYLRKHHLRQYVSTNEQLHCRPLFTGFFIVQMVLKHEKWVHCKIIALSTGKVCHGKQQVWFSISTVTSGENIYRGK